MCVLFIIQLRCYTLLSFWKTYVPAREMGPTELLKSSSSSFPRAGCWGFTRILLAFVLFLRLSVSGECQMRVPAKGTLTLKSVKRVFDTRVCAVIMTYLVPWNVCYLYYFNGLTSLDLIRRMDHTYGCIT